MREPLPLATIQDAVLEFLRGVGDAVLFGAQAVNACVNEPGMTQDVAILSLRAREFAEEIREHPNARFHIAVRIREVAAGRASKVIAYVARKGQPKAFTDRRDLAALLLKFPQLKTDEGPVRDRLVEAAADEAVQRIWKDLVAEAIVPEIDDEGS